MQNRYEIPYRFQFAIDRLELQLLDSKKNLRQLDHSICHLDDEIEYLNAETDRLVKFSRLVWTESCCAEDGSQIRNLESAFHQSIGTDREIRRLAQEIKGFQSEKDLACRQLEKHKRKHAVILNTINKLKAHKESQRDLRQPGWSCAIDRGYSDELQG